MLGLGLFATLAASIAFCCCSKKCKERLKQRKMALHAGEYSRVDSVSSVVSSASRSTMQTNHTNSTYLDYEPIEPVEDTVIVI